MNEITDEDVREVVAQLAQCNKATEENVVSNLAGFHCTDQQTAESAVRGALMRGELYKPQNDRLARVSR